MIIRSKAAEHDATIRAAEAMAVVARTAPKACGIDATDTLILDGADKDRLTATMQAIGEKTNKPFFVRDADCVDRCHCILLLGTSVEPRKLNCGLCGVANCGEAKKAGIPCVMAVDDLGIAVGSAAATAMDYRVDNRVLFTAGMAALELGLFPESFKVVFGIGLATAGKNIFFDRPLP
ncbi:ferredoxin [Actinomycetota bacterium]|nr:ferredoxin [Actinomycetota bacterium]